MTCHFETFHAYRLPCGRVFIVDEQDTPLVSAHKWHSIPLIDTHYVGATINKKSTYLHKLIVNPGPGMEVDHKNLHGWDNRRRNLRECTHAQNLAGQRLSRANTTGFKGLRRQKSGRWAAQTKVMGKMINIGTYDTKEEAASAYDDFVTSVYGDFARTNRSLGLL